MFNVTALQWILFFDKIQALMYALGKGANIPYLNAFIIRAGQVYVFENKSRVGLDGGPTHGMEKFLGWW